MREHGVEQNIAACNDVRAINVFGFVMAETILARNKYHASWRNARNINGIVSGPTDHHHRGLAQDSCRLCNVRNTIFVENNWR
jgi:hypothetical protein